MADDIILAAETGRPTGSAASRRLRATGKIPAVLYGRGADPASLTVDWRELRAALTTEKGLNALLTVKVDGKATKAVVKELQRHPVRRDVLHVDFLAVDVTQEIDAEVPIHLEGEALLVTRENGVVDQVMNSIVVNAKPDAVPGQIVVDISELEIGTPITVAELDLPAGVTTDVEPEDTVVTAHVTREIEEEEPELEEGEELEGEAAEAAEGEGEGAEAAEDEGGE
jgi:large subunit ribosomal protein L25